MEYSSIKNEAPMMPVPHAPAMGCVEAITKCFNNYANFNGRATRAEFWWFYLLNVVVSALSSLPAIGFIFSIISLALIIPSLAVAWRRTHDVGKGGGWNFCPIYNIVLWCTPSEMTPNRFGPVPPNA